MWCRTQFELVIRGLSFENLLMPDSGRLKVGGIAFSLFMVVSVPTLASPMTLEQAIARAVTTNP